MAHERLRPEYFFDQEKIEQLKQLAPECFEDGKINFDTLRQNLGDWRQDEEDPELEHFGLFWPGKRDARRAAAIPPEGTLEPVWGEGLKADGTPDTDGVNDSKNFFIEGENLEVIKILQKSYAGKIKMIYIDPPYNTGNDFVYDDNFTEPLQEYLRRTGQVDEEGKPMTTNKRSDGRFHSKWLSMMYPRLRLARNLLREDGVIFVSIDDNEVHNLRAIMNEIFGEENFIATFIWEKRTNRENRKLISVRHDYLICFSKEEAFKEEALNQLPMSEEALARYSNPDNDHRGPWKSDPASAQAGHGTPSQFYILKAPNGKEHHLQSGRCWVYTEAVMNKAIADNRIWFGKDGNNVPRVKTYLNSKVRGLTPESILFSENASTNESAKNYLKDLFGGKAVFDTPKPVELIELVAKMGVSQGIILDFFSGSASTAEAVYRLNNADKGDRSFICIQLPELCAENSEAAKLGYRHISNISLERIKLASKKYSSENTDNGFMCLSLKNSSFKKWHDIKDYDITKLEHSIDLFNNSPLQDGWNKSKLLTEILLLEGFLLDSVLYKTIMGHNEVYRVECEEQEHQMLICMDEKVEKETITSMKLGANDIFICLDSAISTEDKLRLSDKGLIKTI